MDEDWHVSDWEDHMGDTDDDENAPLESVVDSESDTSDCTCRKKKGYATRKAGLPVQQGIQLDREKLSCSICLDLLKDPVTIPCGHSYCMSCIKDCWDKENEKETCSCPQCGHSFSPRPVLMKSTILAELVEELRKVELQAASLDHSYAGPEDVACDFCPGRKLKAFKSCLVCMVSYCEQHLQPHYSIAPLKKHKLVDATLKLQENICSRHDEVMKIFCRTDKQSICYLCSMDDHKGHDTVSASAERAERQTELRANQQTIQQRVQDREKDVNVLQQRVEAINVSLDQAVKDSEIFTDLVRLLEERSSKVKKRIRYPQISEVSRAEELEEKLEQEITELRRKDSELEKLSHTEDHLHFLNNYPALSSLSESKDLPSIDIHPLRSFEDVTAAVSEARDKLQAVLDEEWTKISLAVTTVEVLPPEAEPRTRAEFLKYSRQITLDPKTANKKVSLINWQQVLSKEGLSERCYWEVKWRGTVSIAVAYKDISRSGSDNESEFGYNDKSWSLLCSPDSYQFRHNNIPTSVSGPQSSTVGVYLNHRAGTLSYYNVSETMTLLHRVYTTFTQPLYAGLWLPNAAGDTAELCELE